MYDPISSIKPPTSEPAIRVVMMPRDTNAEGTIFGGVLLSYIDQACYVEAKRQAHHNYVTVAMTGIEFKEPVFVGDVVSFYARTTRIGRTSISIKVEVIADRFREEGKALKVTEADVVFVAIDESRRPVSIRPQ